TAQEFLEAELTAAITELTGGSEFDEDWDLQPIAAAVRQFLPLPPSFNSTEFEGLSRQEIVDRVLELARELYDAREAALGEEMMRWLERVVLLSTMDELWVQHLTALDDLREGIGLRAYGQQDPLVAYKREAYSLYEQFQAMLQHLIARRI